MTTTRSWNIFSTLRTASLSFLIGAVPLGVAHSAAGDGPAAAGDNSAAAQPTSPNEDVLQQIVVTAEKKESTAQTTPISMTVYSNQALSDAGVVNMETLAYHDPELNFTSEGGLPILTLRGVASYDTSEIGDPAVAVDTDGFFVNRPYSLNSTFYDLDRVEVLHGPQGTLYGRNAIGGVVNVITAKPTTRFEGSGSLELGNYGTQNVDGMLNIPVSDVLQVRAAFSSKYHDGYRDNPPQLDRGDDENSRSARVTVAFSPLEDFKGLVTYQTLRVGGVGQVEKLFPFVYQADGVDPVHQMPVIGDSHTFYLGAPYYRRLEDNVARWNFTYSGLPDRIQVTYLGGHDDMEYHAATNNTVGVGQPQQFVENEWPKTQNHELRFASADDGRLTWQVGAFYFRELSRLDSYGQADVGAPAWLIQGEYYEPLIQTQSRALYGQASYKIADAWKITAGARYTSDDKTRYGTVYNENRETNPTDSSSLYGHARSTKATWHAGVEWTPTPSNLEYLKVDTGYKAGGFAALGPYGPETVTSYEVGSKNRFWNDTVEANLAVFDEEYKDQQVQQAIPGTTESSVQNAGRSRIYGAELQLTALVPYAGKFDLSTSYLHARFVDFQAINATGTANEQLAGNALPQAPNWSIGAGLEHHWTIPAVGVLAAGQLTGRVETKYQTTQYFSFFNYGSTRQGPYAISNASLQYGPDHGNWDFQVYVRNIANRVAFNEAIEDYNALAYTYSFLPPRTAGARIEARF
jgi:iron complex outermembrane receptor protein